MALLLASDDSSVINKKILIEKSDPITEENFLEDQYEISACVRWINSNNFSHVALQFPDHMLVDSATVATAIGKQCQCHLYILADTSYGSCCVDEVAAAHVSADAIIHFGHSCLSPTSHLPVLFVFGKKPVDLNDAVEQFLELFPEKRKIIIVYDVVYAHAAEQFHAQLCPEYSDLILSTMITENAKSSVNKKTCLGCTSCKNEQIEHGGEKSLKSSQNTIVKIGRTIKLPQGHMLSDYCMFYIGEEGQCLINLMMSFNKCAFYSYNPKTKIGKKEALSMNKSLMRRYYLIEKAKDANIVGILIGTLGVSDYLVIIKQLKQLIKNAGKKSYTIVVGKINIAKLANFPEIDVYVLVACSENTLIESKDFYKPIVTPYEMEIACNTARPWTGDYITDFRLLLPGSEEHIPIEVNVKEDAEVSLTTGRVRTWAIDSEDDGDDKALVKREGMVVALHKKAAGEFLTNRSWKGLDPEAGEALVKKAVEGQHGIASGYKNEEPYVKNSINTS